MRPGLAALLLMLLAPVSVSRMLHNAARAAQEHANDTARRGRSQRIC